MLVVVLCLTMTVTIMLVILCRHRHTTLLSRQHSFPFRSVIDRTGVRSDVVVIGAPFRSDSDKDKFIALKQKGVKMIGFTHYQNFPGPIDNPFEDHYYTSHRFDYISNCDAWCYCHRDPDALGIPSGHRLQLVESDFADPMHLCAHTDCANTEKTIDFIYSLPSELSDAKLNQNRCSVEWQAHCRNWSLAKKCIPILCNTLNLKGAIIGRDCEDDVITLDVRHSVTLYQTLAYSNFLTLMRKARFLFVPNVSDASPRVITEAMSMNVPVIMNKNIIGGWKYVNDETGAFFTDMNDLHGAVRHVLTLKNVQEAYLREWGRQKSSKKFARFLNEIGVPADETVMLKI